MNNICTTIEQSKKLIELGINVNTADMWWQTSNEEGVYEQENPRLLVGSVPKYMMEYLIPIPAWSLSALLELMPTDDKKDEYYVDTESHSDYHTVSYRNCWDGCIHSEYSEESLLDAAFEMICWLLENKKL